MIDTDNSFPLSLTFEGKQYHGKVTPSEEVNKAGTPVYFRVALDGEFFAYLCCSDNGWLEKDGGSKPKALINAIGQYIKEVYE